MTLDTQHPISRRTAIRLWLARSAPLALVALSGALTGSIAKAAPAGQTPRPAPVQIPSTAPSETAPAAKPSSATPSAGTAPATGATVPSCVLTREQTEGPYYIDVDLLRSDITEGKEGVPLSLELTVLNAASCQPISGATVEVWHCDAAGDYSGFSSALPDRQGEPPGSDSGDPPPGRPGPGGGPRPVGPLPGGPPGGPPPGSGPGMRNTPTNDLVFLRGGQISDDDGQVTFQTIYPGWYRGRTVHIHLKVHVGGDEVHTSQLFFDDALSDQVFAQQPYAAHPGRDTMNETDGIFLSGGRQGLLTMTPSGSGYTGTTTLGVQV